MVQCVVLGVSGVRCGALRCHCMGEVMARESERCSWVVRWSRKRWVGRDMR